MSVFDWSGVYWIFTCDFSEIIAVVFDYLFSIGGNN